MRLMNELTCIYEKLQVFDKNLTFDEALSVSKMLFAKILSK